MQKVKYYMTNDDGIIAIVYEGDKYGRTMVLNNCEINFNMPIEVISADTSQKVNDVDLIDFLQSLLPKPI